MYQVIREQKRPNIDVNFFSIAASCGQEVVDYWNTEIIGTGKQISNSHTLSEDGLTLISVIVFKSKEAWQEMIADRYLNENLFVTQDAYNKDNNIVRIFKSAKEI
jgi:hypothetical protein